MNLSKIFKGYVYGRSKIYGNITLKLEDGEKLVKLANSKTSEYHKGQRNKNYSVKFRWYDK